MNPADALTSLAEIAITLAGFTGLITVFRSARAWTSQEFTRLGTIMAACFVCLVSALLPFGIAHYTTSPVWIFGLPLAVFAGLHLTILGYLGRAYRTGRFEPSRGASWAVLMVNGVVAVVLLLSVPGWLFEPSAGLLVLACTWGIVYPSLGFLLLFGMVIRQHRDEATALRD